MVILCGRTPMKLISKSEQGQCGEQRVFLPAVCLPLSNWLIFFPGRVIVATSKGVYILVPLPLEKQIQDLLASHRVEEALVLAKGARRNIPKEKFQVCTTDHRKHASGAGSRKHSGVAPHRALPGCQTALPG